MTCSKLWTVRRTRRDIFFLLVGAAGEQVAERKMTNNTGALYLASVASSRDGALSFTENTWCAQQRVAAPALRIL